MHSFHPASLIIICFLVTHCHGNQYDPHVYPATGPFFEGWYLRAVDIAQQVSLGVLFGRVLPENSSYTPSEAQCCVDSPLVHNQAQRLVVLSVLFQDGNTSKLLKAYESTLPLQEYSVTVNGGPVIHNPDDKSPPNFAVRFGKNGKNGSVVVTPGVTIVDVRVGSVSVYLEAVDSVPWGPGGEGPESWLDHLPLPLHWFVYSLRSTVTKYKITGPGRTLIGRNARLHMEKNWGKSFPPAWIWSQGVTQNNVSLALSGGVVDFDYLNVTAFLVGYRNSVKNISFSFTPVNSEFSFHHNACQGFVDLTMTAFEYRLEVKIVSPVSSFSDCLLGPEKQGFRQVCVESYNAVALVKAYKRERFQYVLKDEVDISQTALEFGGLYVCKNACSVGRV